MLLWAMYWKSGRGLFYGTKEIKAITTTDLWAEVNMQHFDFRAPRTL
jgi:hypothetical protein